MKQMMLLVLLLICAPFMSHAEKIDWSAYAGLLHDYVHAGEKNGVQVNLVDYAAWQYDDRWQKILADLADFDLQHLETSDEQLAFWINAYNMMAIKKVLEYWPTQSIRDAGNFFNPVWKQPVGKVAGKMRTLDEIEHQILRPMGEPLMHIAIVCASVSCPDLCKEPYEAARLKAQLHKQAEIFLKREHKGLRVDKAGLHVSKIFDWFEDDFANVSAWLHQYRKDISADAKIISYLPYDWHVNAL